MATSKTLAPTNVTISIPAMTDAPNASVISNCLDKEADAINALNSQKVTKYRHSITNQSVITTSHISDAISACATSGIRGSVAIEFYRTDQSICVGTLWYNITSATYGAGILTSYYNDYLQSVFCVNGTFTMKRIALVD